MHVPPSHSSNSISVHHQNNNNHKTHSSWKYCRKSSFQFSKYPKRSYKTGTDRRRGFNFANIRRIYFAYQESKKYHDLALFLYKWLEFRELKYLFKWKISRKRFCTHFKRIENYWLTVNIYTIQQRVFKCFWSFVSVVVCG